MKPSHSSFCDTQEEEDRYWENLSEGGNEKAKECGWSKERYGASWQAVPRILIDQLLDAGSAMSQRVMRAKLQMQISTLRHFVPYEFISFVTNLSNSSRLSAPPLRDNKLQPSIQA